MLTTIPPPRPRSPKLTKMFVFSLRMAQEEDSPEDGHYEALRTDSENGSHYEEVDSDAETGSLSLEDQRFTFRRHRPESDYIYEFDIAPRVVYENVEF